jgi:ATP-binding cassette subfamily F protein 3
MLHVNGLTYRIAGRVILDDATAVVPTGHKVGLVGPNGTGKSTLLRLILGDISADAGSINVQRGARVGTVAQEAPSGEVTPLEVVMAADVERAALLAEAETTDDPHRISEIHTRLADIGSHSAHARAGAILHGLGFDAAMQARAISSFSGGWRMRVALAAVLFSEPDLLLLDEPTNYLDLEGTLWLEDFLAKYPRTILIVSHDRDLLNTAVDSILHLDDGKLVFYTGNYDRFERTRREKAERQLALKARQEEQRRHMEEFVARFRAKASKARQAQSRLKALARLEPIVAVSEARAITFRFPNPDALPPPLVTMEGVSVGYEPGRPVLRRLNLRLDMEDRIALLGSNGNGKSTFAKLLAGRLQPADGALRKSQRLRVGYFAQHQVDELDPGGTPLSHMAALMKGETETRVRARLGAFGFGADTANVKVSSLSGGEKARLLFACMSFAAPHLMILDEPTNHLDVDAREALVHAINAYEGAVILISHDRHLLEACADRLWLVADGTVAQFDGDLEDYKRLVLGSGGQADKAESAIARVDRRDARREAADARAAKAPFMKAARSAEQEIERLTAERKRIEQQLADPALYSGPPEKLANLTRTRADLERRIAAAEETWLEAQAALEAG